MSAHIQILDYGSGNLFSIESALNKIYPEGKVNISSQYDSGKVDGLVLPGVGSFPSSQQVLRHCRDEIIKDIEKGMPVLGICLGMQLMFEKSEEGIGSGLGLFRGDIVRFDRKSGIKVPHMGWNLVRSKNSEDWAYFAHSYYPRPLDTKIIRSETSYGGETFPSIIQSGAVVGTQFHPEKSGRFGLDLINEFVKSVSRKAEF